MANNYRTPISIRILLFVNFITLLLSIVVLGVGIWLTQRAYAPCSSRLQWLVIAIGLIMFVLSLIGFVGAKNRAVGLLWMYIALLTIVIVLLIIFTVFAFLLKSHGFGTLINAQLRDATGDYVPPLLRKSECQAQFLLRFKKDWSSVATISLIVLIVLLVLYALACSAFMHAMNQRVCLGPSYR